jgi:hypothetical protein
MCPVVLKLINKTGFPNGGPVFLCIKLKNSLPLACLQKLEKKPNNFGSIEKKVAVLFIRDHR